MISTINAKIPEKLTKQIELLVKEGWFLDIDTLVADALRRFLESHKPDLMEHFILEDVEWGLRGKE